ncbi:autotransporter assembly complex protein TamB [Vibrio sp. LaRot3]|uniref:autotransporter assembly complex protein TamB n=1 Tax=Vibrio sp. LaRot3 TaxID=2998829 RepID=UPI0022CDBE44|nr:translocation/assembly module TamB domain-containing protein [Vibrio sp. LaRot3]MDA0149916.1 translocation/assembly module TamB [Vibrio sp. LaRot3]
MTKIVLKWSKWLSISFVSLLLAISVVLAILLFSKPGLSLAVWTAEKFVPQLKIGDYQGAIFPKFSLENVQFNDESLNIEAKADSVTLAVKAACFSEPSLCIDEVALSGLTFNMPQLPESTATAPAQEPESSSTITSPLPIRVGRIALNDIDLKVLGHHIQWQQFTTGFSFQGSRLALNRTLLAGASVELAQSEEASEKASEQKASKDPQSTAIVLPEVVLPLSIDAKRIDIKDFTLQQATPIEVTHLGLELLAHQSKIDLKTLELAMSQVSANASGNVELTGDYPLDVSLSATVHEAVAKGQTLELKANGSAANLNLEALFGGLVTGELKGAIQPLDPQLPFDLALTETKAQWPLQGKADYQADIDELKVQGSLKGYGLALQGEAKGTAIPAVGINVKGAGDLEHIQFSQMILQTLGGTIEGKVMANWQAPVNWQAQLELTDIQPGLQWPEAEGSISGSLKTDGALTQQGGWQVNLPQLDIDGILRDYPLNIEGSLIASDKAGKGDIHLKTPRLVLSHGPNSVQAEGELDKQWRLDLTLQLPDLVKSVPDLKGQAQGSVNLRGDLKHPQVQLNLTANSLAWQEQAKVKQVYLSGSVKPMPEVNGDLVLRVEDASYQGNVIDQLLLKLVGTQKQHQLTLDLTSDIASTSLSLDGSLKDKPTLKWDGALTRMGISSQQGDWQLNQPTALAFDAAKTQVSVAAHCWLQQDASICLQENITVGESGEAKLAIKQFDFAQIAMFLPKETKLDGGLEAEAWAKWAPKTAPQVDAKVRLSKGQVSQQFAEPLVVGWQSVDINAKLANNKLEADWLLDVTDNGDVTGRLMIPDVTVDDKQLQAKLALSTFNLGFLNSLLGEYSELNANVSTDLDISGPLMHPQVNGQFVVDDMLLQGEVSPIDIDSGRLEVNFSGYQALIDAAIQTPDGQLDVEGNADWQDLANWQSKVRVFADELMVNAPPMVRVKVVPDMTISASPKNARIDGSIALPWGRVVVEDVPASAVGVSKDLVIVDASGQPVDEESKVPFEVETNINIKIGDDFKLSAFGLEGGLVGNLNVTQKNKGPFIVGEVNIVDGSYSSFGQDLLIKEGKILMNGPADQPYLQISAIRNPENTQDEVIAGVKVTGSADEPQVAIFSEPAMPQANALSYLLRGQDIDGESGGNAMTTTLIGLSLAKSGRLVGEIGEAFGVQDLQLDTAGTGDDSQVTVSGYILPGLQVKYGVGIFDSVGEFTVRYRLMKDLYVEAVSGLDSAVDLLYQFEFD